MAEKTNRKIIYPKSDGFFQGLSLRIKLILRLIADPRVNVLLKALPIGSIVYLVMPDFMPGPIDDALVIWLATYLFVELCPPDIVQEHLEALKATRKVMDNYEETSQSDARGEVIDGEIVDGDVEAK
jgi:hypothetical protein